MRMGVVPSQQPGSHMGMPTWFTTISRVRNRWGHCRWWVQWGIPIAGVVLRFVSLLGPLEVVLGPRAFSRSKAQRRTH